MNIEHICIDAEPEDFALLNEQAKQNFTKQKGFHVIIEQWCGLDESKQNSFVFFNMNAQKTVCMNFNVDVEDAKLLDMVQAKYNLTSKGKAVHVLCNAKRGISETAVTAKISQITPYHEVVRLPRQGKQETVTETFIAPMPIEETQQEKSNRLFKNDGYCPSQKRMVPTTLLVPNCQICKDGQGCKWCLTKKPSNRDLSGDRLRETLFLKREALETEEKIKLDALTKAMDKKDEIAQRQFDREYKLQLLKVPRLPTSEKWNSETNNQTNDLYGKGVSPADSWLSVNPSYEHEETQHDRFIEQLVRENAQGSITPNDLIELRQIEKIDPIAIAKIELQQKFPESRALIEDYAQGRYTETTTVEITALTDKEESDLNAYFYFLHFCLKCNRAISQLTGNVIIKATSDVVFEQNPAENLRNLSIAVLGEVAN